MPPSDLLSALLDLVRAAAREDSTQTRDRRDAPTTRSAARLVGQRVLAHTPGESTGSVDRPCRPKRIPVVHERDLRLFKVETVGSAVRATGPTSVNALCAHPRCATGGRGGAILSRDRVRLVSGRPLRLGTAS